MNPSCPPTATAVGPHAIDDVGAIAQLAPEFREAIVLREMEGCSYKEIADIAGVRIGTVMSRLARGRRELHRILAEERDKSGGTL